MPFEHPSASQEQARQEHKRKLDSDPTRQFLRDQGFKGDPKVLYSMDVISATNSKGHNLMGSETFDNFEDLQSFIKDNPNALTQRQKDQMKKGITPFRTDYDKSVYDWSGNLSPEKSKQMLNAFDGFAAENFDTRKWGSKEEAQEKRTEKPKEKTPQEIKRDISRTEKESLRHLDNPEMSRTVADPKDLEEVVREMGDNAKQFEDPEKKILASMAQNNLEQLNQLLSSGKPEDLMKADQVVADYLYRNLSQELTIFFNRTDLPLEWEDKKKLLDQNLVANKISKRQDVLKSRDLISLRKRVGEQIGQYLPKQEQSTAKVSEAEIEKKRKRAELLGEGAYFSTPIADSTEQSAPKVSKAEAFDQDAKTGPEKDKTAEKTPDAKIKFGTVLDSFVRQFQDGTIPESFREFLNSKPTSREYEAAASMLKRLNNDYLNDKRSPGEKIPEFTDKVRDVAERLTPVRLKFNYYLDKLQSDLGNLEGYGNLAEAFESLYGDKAKSTPEQWKNAADKIAKLSVEYSNDKRLKSDKNAEWLKKIRDLSNQI